jgi:plastocyanin domain-containing protein
MTARYSKLVDNNSGYAIKVIRQKQQIEMQTEHRLRFLNDQKVEKTFRLKGEHKNTAIFHIGYPLCKIEN